MGGEDPGRGGGRIYSGRGAGSEGRGGRLYVVPVPGRPFGPLEPPRSTRYSGCTSCSISTAIIMTNIMIMGDSWACGEWGGMGTQEGHRPLHPGTELYLREAGHSVRSVADGGSSNWAQVDRMSPHHPYQRDTGGPHSMRDTEVIIWFLTDPCRDTKRSPASRLQDYVTLMDGLMRTSLRDMARLYPHCRMLLIGGVSPVPQWVAAEFPQFEVVVESLLHWLIPTAPRDLLPGLCRIWEYPDCEPDLLDHWESCEMHRARFIWRAEHRQDTPEHRWFWPDGVHPNRLAHRRLTEELILPLLAAEQATDDESV